MASCSIYVGFLAIAFSQAVVTAITSVAFSSVEPIYANKAFAMKATTIAWADLHAFAFLNEAVPIAWML